MSYVNKEQSRIAEVILYLISLCFSWYCNSVQVGFLQ